MESRRARPALTYRVQAAALLPAERRPRAVEGADPRPRLALRLQRRRERRRVLRLLPASQGGHHRAASSAHASRRGLRVAPAKDVKAFLRGIPLRIRLVAAVVALSAAGLALTGVVATAALHSYLLQRVDSQLATAVQLPGEQFCSEFPGPGGGPPRGGHQQLPSQYYVAKYTDDGSLTCSIHASTTDDIPALTGLTAARISLLSSHPFNAASASGDTAWRGAGHPAPDGGGASVGAPPTHGPPPP